MRKQLSAKIVRKLLRKRSQVEGCETHECTDELNEWCKRAFKGDDEARQKLLRLQDRLEPEWMFWQAEQFAACFSYTDTADTYHYINEYCP
jgi:hypothetical protein